MDKAICGFGTQKTVTTELRTPGWVSMGTQNIEHIAVTEPRSIVGGAVLTNSAGVHIDIPPAGAGAEFALAANLALLARPLYGFASASETTTVRHTVLGGELGSYEMHQHLGSDELDVDEMYPHVGSDELDVAASYMDHLSYNVLHGVLAQDTILDGWGARATASLLMCLPEVWPIARIVAQEQSSQIKGSQLKVLLGRRQERSKQPAPRMKRSVDWCAGGSGVERAGGRRARGRLLSLGGQADVGRAGACESSEEDIWVRHHTCTRTTATSE